MIQNPPWANNPTAIALWAAYQRIVDGQPTIVRSHSRITKSLVAREAGYQRSTLSKIRFPDLCKLIDDPQKKDGHSAGSSKSAKDASKESALNDQIAALKAENSNLISKLVSLETAFIAQGQKLQALENKWHFDIIPTKEPK